MDSTQTSHGRCILNKNVLKRARFNYQPRIVAVPKIREHANYTAISLPGRKSEGSAWTEIEQVLPDQFSERVETPANDNELHRGSIIQKLSPSSKLGQTLKSPRQQIQRTPMRQEPGFGTSEKRNLSPKDRLFTRVQELEPEKRK